MSSSIHFYSAVDPAADPNNSWNLKLASLYGQAQAGRRIRLYDASERVFPEDYIVKLGIKSLPEPSIDTLSPSFPVVWPRGTTPVRAWAHIDELSWMGSAAASVELGYAEIAMGGDRTEFRKLAALVTALRCSASRALGIDCINVWRPSHEMATFHEGKLALLRISKSPINRIFSASLDRREKVAMDYTKVAMFGAYFLAIGAMARIGGGRYAMAMGEGRYAVSRLAELLGADWEFLKKDVYIRDALLSEIWRAFPENIGDLVNSDLIGQEVISRCLIVDPDLMAASVSREAEYREQTARTPKPAPRITRTAPRPAVAFDFSPEPSEVGDTECVNTPVVSYGDIPFTPVAAGTRPLSPIQTPFDQPILWSPDARAKVDATMRSEHAKSQGVSPYARAAAMFGPEDDEPPIATD
jgi:hypothetical protein